MRQSLRVLLGCLALAAAGQARAQPEPARVVACDGLVDLRQLMASVRDDRDAAAARVSAGTGGGCRLLPRAEIGAVERRAMVGGAPYECLGVAAEGRCLWVLP